MHNVIFFTAKVHYVSRWNDSFYVPDLEHMECEQRPCHRYGQHPVNIKSMTQMSSVATEETHW
jgi:hypothetical protein